MNVTTSAHAGYTARRKPPTAEGLPYTEDHSARFEVGEYRFFCVFDGHGVHGHLVAQQAAAQLPKLVQTELGRQADAREALIVAHLEQHRACTAALDCSQSGATAVTCRLAVDPQMSHLVCQTAWLGDARAVVGSVRPDGTLVAVELTTAHTPELLAERMRVEASGGVVAAMRLGELGEVGPLRVWSSAQVAPGLSMTRSLGDTNGAAGGASVHPARRPASRITISRRMATSYTPPAWYVAGGGLL